MFFFFIFLQMSIIFSKVNARFRYTYCLIAQLVNTHSSIYSYNRCLFIVALNLNNNRNNSTMRGSVNWRNMLLLLYDNISFFFLGLCATKMAKSQFQGQQNNREHDWMAHTVHLKRIWSNHWCVVPWLGALLAHSKRERESGRKCAGCEKGSEQDVNHQTRVEIGTRLWPWHGTRTVASQQQYTLQLRAKILSTIIENI